MVKQNPREKNVVKTSNLFQIQAQTWPILGMYFILFTYSFIDFLGDVALDSFVAMFFLLNFFIPKIPICFCLFIALGVLVPYCGSS